MNIFTNRLKQTMLLAAGLSLVAPVSMASTWAGTANYTAATGATGDEAIVGPFDTYDFGSGITLVQFTSATTFTAYFQTMVDGHFLNNAGINVPELNISGAGSGFELTVAATLNGTYSNFSGFQSFNFSGGAVNLYFDTTPDYSFTGDSGFNNGAAILSGTVTGGSGVISPAGVGAEQLDLNFSGIFGSYDSNVYTPGITGGHSIFSINLNNSSLLSGINSVLGQNKSTGVLAAVDGSIQLTAVPVPTAVWLFGTGLIGLISAGKRKNSVA
ncbi:flocculation-associated PEP-CTERM protein PepA [Methylomonas sp. MO1]|uniref:flocculation-associated PEP-CTERM protein PepA n=1 Tax=Methylomonas sp. MO1 TaxID=3073619 RepID=UPI0028A37A9F|nr:flocculation-associated PEP-CTERM protein PepA [Methylomonas sp. MO1]MDT4288017.1 flocculation-associated PEP-CTERM protein PepA [Methylomonas sp. MO1]